VEYYYRKLVNDHFNINVFVDYNETLSHIYYGTMGSFSILSHNMLDYVDGASKSNVLFADNHSSSSSGNTTSNNSGSSINSGTGSSNSENNQRGSLIFLTYTERLAVIKKNHLQTIYNTFHNPSYNKEALVEYVNKFAEIEANKGVHHLDELENLVNDFKRRNS